MTFRFPCRSTRNLYVALMPSLRQKPQPAGSVADVHLVVRAAEADDLDDELQQPGLLARDELAPDALEVRQRGP